MVLSLEEGNPSTSPDLDEIALYLPPRSLYVLRGKYRYDYRHEILGPFSKRPRHPQIGGGSDNDGDSCSSSCGGRGSMRLISNYKSDSSSNNGSGGVDGFDRRLSIIFRNEK